MVDTQVACPKCGEPKDPYRNCQTCWTREREADKTRQTERASALLSMGFSTPAVAGGMFGAEFVTCLKCGAAVHIAPFVEGQAHPLDLHAAWHSA